MERSLCIAGLLGAWALGLGARQAYAEPSFSDEAEVDPTAGTKRGAAPDERLGHLIFGVQGGAVGLAGAMAPNTPSRSLSSVGYDVGGWLGVGISRYGTFQAFGEGTWFMSPGACDRKRDCGGRAFVVGLGFTYHLAQGLAFDPWGSFGVALRDSAFTVLSTTQPVATSRHYRGIDVARIAFGGDFYPTPFLGFGPYIEGDFGTNFQWPDMALPEGLSNTARAYAFFQIGLRVSFDPMRKARPASTTTAHAPAVRF